MTTRDAYAIHGPTKLFFEDGTIDHLLAMSLALGAELSAVSEKLDTVIHLLERHDAVSAEAVAAFEPDADEQARRDAARHRFVQSLLAPFQHAADELQREAERRTADGGV